ncbi:MAG: hypothetical protein RL567_499 [Bacteroidota bacterium]|jgi:hypothetical protein
MIDYIQQLLPRIRQFSSQLDKKELFVDKLFTLLQPNNDVHQYTFIRGGKLILTINGKGIEGTWELLPTGQLLINRGSNDIITLDFDFLHPDVLIMKLGGTANNPFIIYRQEKIENGNVLKFLQLLNVKNRGEKVYELPGSIISESDLNEIIKDENGNVFNGLIYSLPFNHYLYSHRVRNVKKVKNGIVWEEFHEVKYPAYNNTYDYIIILQSDISTIQIGDKLIGVGPISRNEIKISETFIPVHNYIAQFDDKNYIVSLRKDNTLLKVFSIIILLIVCIFAYFQIAKYH